MSTFLRQGFLIAIALAVSWWAFLRVPVASGSVPARAERRAMSVSLVPVVDARPRELAGLEQAVALAAPATVEEEEVEEPAVEPAPHAPDAGAPEGKPEVPPVPLPPDPVPESLAEEADEPVTSTEPAVASTASTGPPRSEELMRDAELLDAAQREFSGEVRQGFASVLLAAPEDQLDIARFFGEELVLVPKSCLDPEAERTRYFRIAPGKSGAASARVETVTGRPPLERYRQYRDLFDYEYARLPDALRALRRSVLSRGEVYLFAALLPPAEWAVVIARRTEALARTGRTLDEVRRFVLRYVRRTGGGFDVRVEEIVFADGARVRPASPH